MGNTAEAVAVGTADLGFVEGVHAGSVGRPVARDPLVVVAAPGLEAGLLARVAFPLPRRDFTAIRHAARDRNRAAAALLDLVQA